MIKTISAVALSVFAVACSSSHSASEPDASSGGQDAAEETSLTDGGTADAQPEASTLDAAGIVAARPYTLYAPALYNSSTPAPLLVMFHGYGYSGQLEEDYMAMKNASDETGFLYAYGDGTLDISGNRFWNATNACCDFWGNPVDDVQYFDAIVADVESKYNVDRKRIYVLGHSNGAFMSHRLACDRTSTIAAIFSLAGAQWEDLSNCSPSGPISVAEVHGTADMTIGYDGGTTTADGGTGGTYPSAPTTIADWGQKNGCTGPLAPNGQTYTIDSTLPPNQTQVQAFSGCPAGIDVQLWVVQGGPHVPVLTPNWPLQVWGFLSTHSKP